MAQRIINSEQDFVNVCKDLDNEGIYEAFSGEGWSDAPAVVSQKFRDDMLELYADEDTPEPCRMTLIALGEKYNVQSLIDY